MNSSFQFSDPSEALDALAERITGVTETETVSETLGRVLAEETIADRDSPAADVSAMDGYAIRLDDLQVDVDVKVSAECQAGTAPPSMLPGRVIRIFTGAMVPDGAQAIVKREDTIEAGDSIRFPQSTIESIELGSHIRRRGENAAAGSSVLPAGIQVTPSVMAALANFGCARPLVYRKSRLSILTTGDEVVSVDQPSLEPWQLRNSNLSVVSAMVRRCAFVELTSTSHIADDRDELARQFQLALNRSDAVVLTGGVSKGDYDFVPDMIVDAGAEIVFHGLPIRPGKPILAAVSQTGQLVLGLPGNPVSATVNSHRFLISLLRKMAGLKEWKIVPEHVTLTEPPAKPIPLHTMPLVKVTDPGQARLIKAMGSGDLVALAQSDGYVMIPPGEQSCGPWPMYRW